MHVADRSGVRSLACAAGLSLALAAGGVGAALLAAQAGAQGAGEEGAAPVAEAQGAAMSAGYSDVAEGDWWLPYVAYVTGRGVMGDEDGDGAFGARAQATRAEVVSALWRMAGSPEAAYGGQFSDVAPEDDAAAALAWALSAGVVSAPEGGSGAFRPSEAATREEAAAMVARYAHGEGSGDLSAFPDGGRASAWAAPALSWCASAGLISGESGTGLLKPGDPLTRAQLAKVLTKASALGRRAAGAAGSALAAAGDQAVAGAAQTPTTAGTQDEGSAKAGASADTGGQTDSPAASQQAAAGEQASAGGTAYAPYQQGQAAASFDAADGGSSGSQGSSDMGGSTPSSGSASTGNAAASGGSSSGTAAQPAQRRWVVDQAAYDEQVWVVDQAAYDEQVWVVDQAAYDEQVLVSDAWDETVYTGVGYYYYYADGYKAYSDSDAFDHGVWLDNQGLSTRYTCLEETETIHHDAEYETVHHDEIGHTETVHHDEIGHTETVHHDEVGHWE